MSYAQSLGHYSLGVATGVIAAATTGELFQFRWADATRQCLVRRIRIAASVSTTFFAAGVPLQIDMAKCTGWSGAGTGGTAVTPAATLKRRTSQGSTLIAAGDIRIASTAALGAGTKTIEANSMAQILAAGPTAAPGTIIPLTTIWSSDEDRAEHPLDLVANEGFILRAVAVPATGTWQLSVCVDWRESTDI